MSLFFKVSHQTPIEPVLSPVSGAIFEKNVIEKYISLNGFDPITRRPLLVNQLIRIWVPAPADNALALNAANIPEFLDANTKVCNLLLYQTLSKRENIKRAQTRLHHAVYQCNATFNVIRRLKHQIQKIQKPHKIGLRSIGIQCDLLTSRKLKVKFNNVIKTI